MTSSRSGIGAPHPNQQSVQGAKQQNCDGREPVLGDARKLRAFRTRLLAWYDGNKRDLPWRVTKDAYRVCISEIMLQQTRVAVVKEYYPRFLVKFPTLRNLARARLASVLTAWSGLGYYRRARALHAAARVLVAKHGGRFPQTADELQSLPGVGRYTAAAIASIAFNQPTPVVDGNVERVITRLLAHRHETAQLWKAAGEILDTTRPGDFNQAMMELGATVCLPRQPLCHSCPVFRWCASRGEFGDRPVERRKKATLRYCLATDKGSVFLVQRPAGAPLMAGMWELPEIAPGAGFPSNGNGGFKLRHSITITDYTVEVLHGEPPEGSKGRWIPKSRISAMPLTGLTRKIFRRSNII